MTGRQRVYEVFYSHQREYTSYGLYSSKEKAMLFLSRLGIAKIRATVGEHTYLEGDYEIVERIVV